MRVRPLRPLRPLRPGRSLGRRGPVLPLAMLRRRARPGRAARLRRPQARLWAFIGIVVCLLGTLLGRLTEVQVGQRDDYLRAAATVNTRQVVQPSVRGRILDAGGKPLVDNVSAATVTIERGTLLAADDEGRDLVTRVATVLGLPPEQLWGRTRPCGTSGAPRAPACFNGSPYQPIPVATGVDERRALSLLEQPGRFPGVAVVAEPVRHYPHPGGVNASQLLGYLGRATGEEVSTSAGRIAATDLVGRAGLEGQYDAVLRGVNGRTTLSVDPRGVVTGRLSGTDPVTGDDVVTHLSAPIQAASERALADAVAAARRAGQRADSGAAVVVDVTNGAVVASASYPTYEPEVWTGGISQRDLDAITDPAAGTPLVNRATSSLFPPASTFKVVSLPAAIEAGNSLTGTYDCGSSYRVGNRDFQNYESRAYGRIGLRRAVVISCDTIFYQFAYHSWLAQGGLSAATDTRDPFVSMARAFGLGRATGVDLPGESAGRIPDRQWKQATWAATRTQTCAHARTGYPDVAATDPARAAYLKALAVENCASGFQLRPGDAANFAIGQGDIAVTPLQMAQVYAAIANGGTLWRPQLAAAVRTPDGRTVRTMAPQRAGTVPLGATMRAFLDDALRGVVVEGTAAGAFEGFPLATYPVAGKTGTGEVFGQQATSWFASYGPATAPRYAVVVVVNQGGTGGATAAPAVRAIWDAIRTQPAPARP
jgi:penicillin-binding protein 2